MIDIFTTEIGDGLRISARNKRRGGTIMYPSTIVTNYTIIEKGPAVVMDKFTGLVNGKQYEVRIKFIDIDTSRIRLANGEGDRFETIADWQRSNYEWYRQLIKLNSPGVRDIINELDIEGFRDAHEDIFIDILQEEAQFLLYNGIWTIEQMVHYASLHKNSSVVIGDFKGKYGELLASPKCDTKLRLLKSEVRALLEQYLNDSWIRKIASPSCAIRSTEVVHALRSRPGIIVAEDDPSDNVKELRITKTRDRAPGGPKKIGQKYISIYKTDRWPKFKELVMRRLRDLGSDITIESAYINGAKAYVDLLEHNYYYYDISTADKYLPLLILTDNKVDHGVAGYQFPLQVISGGAPTSIDNLRGAKMLVSILKDKGEKITKAHMVGDNVALNTEIVTIDDLIESSQRFCGVSAELGGIAGLKACVDGQGKSANFPTGIKQMVFSRLEFSEKALLQFFVLTNYFKNNSFHDLMFQAQSTEGDFETLNEGLPLSLMDTDEFQRLIESTNVIKAEYYDYIEEISKDTGIPVSTSPSVTVKHLWKKK